MKKITLILICFLFYISNSFALSPEEKLPNQKQEERAMNLFLQVRCLVCQGQVIENSDSEFSFQMRALIREKIAEGKSDEEIKDELVLKFGDDILTSNNQKIVIFTLVIFVISLLLYIKKVKN